MSAVLSELENHVKQLVATDFSGGVDRNLSHAVCLRSVGPPSASLNSLQRDVPSHCGMDRATGRRSVLG